MTSQAIITAESTTAVLTETAITQADRQMVNAYLSSLNTEVGRAGMLSELRKVAKMLGRTTKTTRGVEVGDVESIAWHTLNAANVRAILAETKDSSPATRNKTRAALRGIVRAASELGVISIEERAKINSVRPVGGTREQAGRNVEDWELAAIIRACADDATPSGARDAALFAIAAQTGARREELARLSTDNMTITPDGFEFLIIGKGDRQRRLFIFNGAAKALADWLNVRGMDAGAIFCVVAKGGRMYPQRHMTTTGLHFILQKRAESAGVSKITWHDFRRTFAGVLLDAGEDIATVAALMGHKDPRTTARYDRRTAETRRKAARKVSVPYFARR